MASAAASAGASAVGEHRLGGSSLPKKPLRTALDNGRFLCYKCKSALAVCGDREKACRSCFLNLVRSTAVAQLGKVEERQRKLEREAEAQRQQPPRGSGASAEPSFDRNTQAEAEEGDQRRIWYVAVSGGPSSLALIHILRDLLQERRRKWERKQQGQRRKQLQEERRRRERDARDDAASSSATSSAASPAISPPSPLPLVALHVDVQSLAPCASSASTGEPARPHAVAQELRAALDAIGVPLRVIRPTAAFFASPSSALPCASSSSSDSASVWPPPPARAFSPLDSERELELEKALVAHLHRVLAEDSNAFEALVRAVIFRALAQFCRHAPARASSNAGGGAPPETQTPPESGREGCEADAHPASRTEIDDWSLPRLLCVGDSSTRLAVRLLLKACQGDGATLQQDAELVDTRFLPDFLLSRPATSISAKEAALYCRYTGVPFLTAHPYSVALWLPPPAPLSASLLQLLSTAPVTAAGEAPDAASPAASACRASALAVRPLPLSFLIRSFLLDLQANFPSTISNVLKTSQKAAPASCVSSLLASGHEHPFASPAASGTEPTAANADASKRESMETAQGSRQAAWGQNEARGEVLSVKEKSARTRLCGVCLQGACDKAAFSDASLWDASQRTVLDAGRSPTGAASSLRGGRLCLPCTRAAAAGPASAAVAAALLLP
ncbi:hypothetical protein BESB_073190 [Besnoitia besnoiti]|uniref:Cytoplasmic tRNA 2-thiolation protein 2 n=1 Tax=Besnoitia besnoiti TaxID=94643 RepID=A0A2A9MEV8_BESBE|nr:uncharacterized protein BESB_073190 [Besnoitia besnoiti]PFH34167.1 hypothetical protein BESB_073190 [Besnoitia besnoiti]